MSQTGLRHAATEPDHLDGKRDRSRRSASGRAAALRRAPSDSDCSGETASLSADSADRVRPTPVLLRTAKARSRRRGSEWEVLEGLKDGQRFERRPEVFNGYLHKKRKWPLKGWHKRFFVIDGGILVYARSPTDVARGRLHGSVDVGLSVISAKARRRRIDIDADEFIYHLRAKTPDVFRTWLNVLKAHRLYRQHLLTFGARETVPKIHAPLKELPPIDSSGLSSSSSVMTPCSDDAETFEENFTKVIKEPDSDSLLITPCNQSFDSQNPLSDWNTNVDNTRLMPLSFEPLEEVVIRPDICNRSLCSMNCLAKIYKEELNELMHSSNAPKSVRVAVIEKQLHATELERNSKNFDPYIETSLHRNTSIQNATKDRPIKPVFPVFSDLDEMPSKTKKVKVKKPRDASPFLHKKPEPTTTFFLFAHKDKSGTKSPDFLMRRSKKSTNLVKYRNCADEPPLEKPMESPMLLRHSKSKRNRQVTRNSGDRNAHIIPIINNEVQAAVVIQEIPKEHKSLQDTMTASEYDKLTERIVLSIFEATNSEASDPDDIKTYVNRMVKELYNVKLNETDAHPVKILFKCLLEYWLSNSSSEHIRNALKHAKSVLTHSVHMTKDQNVFTDSISNIAKHKKIDSNHSDVQNFLGNSNTKHVTCSFVKDRQIQKLEKLLKSTIYTTDLLGSSNVSTEKDIKLTKKLLNDFVSCSLQTKDASISMQCADINIGECHCEGLAQEHGKDVSRSSTEYQHIKAAFERFIRDTSAPPDKIQKFLEAYLEVLMDESNTTTQSAQYSNSSDPSNEVQCLKCDVQTDSVQNKVSIGVLTTVEKDTNTVDIANDSGQIYLKNVLEKFTLIFAKHLNQNSKESQDKHVQPDDTKAEGSFKLNKDIKYLITENKDENSMVIDLTNYCLDHISLFNDPTTQNNLSVTIKLKERSPNTGESKPQKLNLKFSRETSMTPRLQSSLHMRVDCSARSYCRANVDPRISFKNPYIHCDPINVKKNVKPFVSASDATSKAFKYIYDSEQSLDFSLRNESKRSFDAQDERSCYCISMPRKSTRTSLIKSKNKYQITKRISKDSSLVLRQFNSKLKPIPKRSQNSVFRNRKSTIDKNFIILLLENLTLLSQNVPELYNEISVFYLKLKKKHENINSGVGLLGRIYNESNSFGETSRQADVSAFPYTQAEPTRVQFTKLSNEIGINTDGQNKNQTDQSVSAVTDFKNAEIQTEGILLKKPSVRNVTTVKMKERGTEVVDIESRANWLSKITKGSAISTAIRSILDNEGSSINFRFVPDDAYTRKAQYVTEKRISFKDLIEQLDSNEKDVDFVELRQSSPGPSRNDPGKHCAVFQMKHKDSDSSSKDKSKKHKNFVVFPLFLSPKFPVVAMSSSCFGSSGESDARVSEDLKTIYRCASVPSFVSGFVSPSLPLRAHTGFVAGTPGGRLANWIVESGGSLEAAGRSLGQAQLSVQQLQRLLDQIDAAPQHHDTDQVSLEGASPNVKKDRRKFGLRKKKSNSKCASVELAPPLHVDISASHTALSALSALAAPPSPGASSAPPASLPIACSAVRPQSLPGAEALSTSAGGGMGGPASLASLTPDQQLREDFTVLAKDLVATLKGVVSTLVCERGRLRAAMEAGGAGDAGGGGGGGAVAALRNNLNSALHQNSELRSRLSRIHDASDLADVSALAALNSATPTAVNHQFQQSLSFSSSGVSASEFFDAEEHDTPLPATPAPVPATAPVPSPDALLIPQDEAAGVIELDGDSSSEAGSLSSEEGSAGSSDNSDGVMLEAETEALEAASPQSAWRRRSRLPRPRPSPGGPSLWNLLYKNIGKDLSQVAMPVTINEPLNMLQRLCEELEYCSLLELAAGCDSALERMALVAAFAVSAYAATAHRAASKPFNPLLGETYECVRPDKGFKFLAEQVSHHPPVSVCQAAGAQWEWWQEARIKTKFWGKSMEFQPAGTVHLTLPSHRDHYEWNKVTTCVHNLFGGQRWVDQYGDMTIVCHNTGMVAKLNFIKASSWSSSRHEVRGFVTDERSGQRLRISGHWSEAIYAGEPSNKRLLWRPGPMPPEHEVYYGFTKFAMELNEMEPGLKDVLPQTDTRFRPDQRALEEGDVEAAEEYKHHLEQAQRERRRDNPTHNPMWFRKISENGEEMWVFTGEYWKARETGFKDVSVPRIW